MIFDDSVVGKVVEFVVAFGASKQNTYPANIKICGMKVANNMLSNINILKTFSTKNLSLFGDSNPRPIHYE